MSTVSTPAPPAKCSYRFVDRDGSVDTCRQNASCPVCGQCSRISQERETGHCTGHLGLLSSIPVPGQEGAKVRDTASRAHPARRGKLSKRPARKQRRAGMGSAKPA